MSTRVPPEILSGAIRSEALPPELDLSELAADMVLRSAETVWALVRTAETVADVNQLDLQEQFCDARNEALKGEQSFVDAMLEADVVLCRLYRFALYEGGADGLLKEVFRP